MLSHSSDSQVSLLQQWCNFLIDRLIVAVTFTHDALQIANEHVWSVACVYLFLNL